MSEDIKELVKEARGWHAGHSDDSQRMVWLMNKLCDALEAMGQDPGMTLEELFEPATDHAPAVCVWEMEQPCVWVLGCDATIHIGFANEYKKCLSCGKPIKFTEAKT